MKNNKIHKMYFTKKKKKNARKNKNEKSYQKKNEIDYKKQFQKYCTKKMKRKI